MAFLFDRTTKEVGGLFPLFLVLPGKAFEHGQEHDSYVHPEAEPLHVFAVQARLVRDGELVAAVALGPAG